MKSPSEISPRFRLEDLRRFRARAGKDSGLDDCRHIIHRPGNPATLTFIPPRTDTPAANPAEWPGGGRGLVISFADDFFCLDDEHRALLVTAGRLREPLQLEQDQARDVQDVLALMKREYAGDGPRRQELLRAYLRVLLLKTAGSPDIASPDEKRLQDFRALLERNFRARHRTADYADLMFISTKCLNELTRKHLGRTPGEIIRERLMREARRLLQSGEFNVSGTARELGFQDPHYFSRFFKRHAGKSPADFLTGK